MFAHVGKRGRCFCLRDARCEMEMIICGKVWEGKGS